MATLLHDPDTHKLGKTDAKPPHIMLGDFFDIERAAAENPPPANIINSLDANGNPIALQMYLNNEYGDCTCAGVGNTLLVDSDGEVEIADSDVLTAYQAVTAEEGAEFEPGPPPVNDNGCNEIDVLDYWTKVGIGGNKLIAHAGVNYNNQLERRIALNECGPLYPGWQLSTDNQNQEIWAPGPAAAGSWGGHCAIIMDDFTEIPANRIIPTAALPILIPKDILEILVIGTWGTRQLARGSWVWFACDELHVPLTSAWLARNENNPALNLAALQAFIKTQHPES